MTTDTAPRPQTALAPRPPMEWTEQGALIRTFDDAWRIAQTFQRSGFFRDAMQDPAQALVKIQAGAELGFSPIASMTNIFLVDGKPGFGASLVLARIIREGGRYRIMKNTAEACEIEWSRKWPGDDKVSVVGSSSFTIDEAKNANLTNKDNWKKYPKAMLFARAVTQGARNFFPDLFLGSVYDPEELETIDMRPDGTPDLTQDPGVASAPKKARPRSTGGMEKLAQAAKADEPLPAGIVDADFTEGPPPSGPTESPPPASSDGGPQEGASADRTTSPAADTLTPALPTASPPSDGPSPSGDQPTRSASAATAASSTENSHGEHTSADPPKPRKTESSPPSSPEIVDPPKEGATLAMAIATQPKDVTGLTKHLARWQAVLSAEDKELLRLAARRAFNLSGGKPEWHGVADEKQAAIIAAIEEAKKIAK